MQRSIAITVVVCLCVQSCALLAILGWVRMAATSEAKRELRSAVHQSEYRCFVVDANNRTPNGTKITWLDAKEFRADDVMYDVVASKDSADVRIIRAFPDTKETWARLHIEPTIQKNVHRRTSTGPLALHLTLLLIMTAEKPRTFRLHELTPTILVTNRFMTKTLDGFDTLPEIPPEEV